ncbi:MAG: DedA family protein [Roseococcus sp.]|nr:DedA family protein [Roseococcus sp.]
MSALTAYVTLFLLAFGAASLLPMQSEPALVGLLLASDHPPWALVLVASLGNTLGSVVNHTLGRLLERFRHRRWFPVGEAALDRAQAWYARWGYWSLLLSWAPIVGDPLTVIAGVMREPLWRFVLIVAVAKTGRYATLAWLAFSLA